ncbi:hypothetical protein PIB30_083793 [Stylosanthes scabra]|uniref:Uncharacterized protein n=1 Tax=Stylosanthes scabra TaxID=79078 RepID=A0ABU6ZQX9_9FABA|nr:hypothetical protein [Stylosanthes scabra]
MTYDTGVTSVALEGDDKDRVVVTGNNVDTICLVNQMNKKFKCVVILKVEEVKKKEDKCCAVLCLPSPPCGSCSGKCELCSKCERATCQCKCVMICSSKCEGNCEKCGKCEKPKCKCVCVVICFKCKSPKCDGQCCNKPLPQPCYNVNNCPPWCNCPRCYVPYNPPPYCYNRVVYESNPDNCSIM